MLPMPNGLEARASTATSASTAAPRCAQVACARHAQLQCARRHRDRPDPPPTTSLLPRQAHPRLRPPGGARAATRREPLRATHPPAARVQSRHQPTDAARCRASNHSWTLATPPIAPRARTTEARGSYVLRFCRPTCARCGRYSAVVPVCAPRLACAGSSSRSSCAATHRDACRRCTAHHLARHTDLQGESAHLWKPRLRGSGVNAALAAPSLHAPPTPAATGPPSFQLVHRRTHPRLHRPGSRHRAPHAENTRHRHAAVVRPSANPRGTRG